MDQFHDFFDFFHFFDHFDFDFGSIIGLLFSFFGPIFGGGGGGGGA